MNSYRIEEIQVGMDAGFSVTVTEEMLRKFLEISGDVNPLHNDEAYAKSFGYPSRVVYGMLTASFYSTLAGVYLPGERCLLYEVDSLFTAPVFVGDTLRVSGKVDKVDVDKKFIRIKTRVVNQNGELVSRGSIVAGVREDGA